MSEDTASSPSPRRWPWLVLAIGSALVIGAGVGWSVATVLTPAQEAIQSNPYTFVSVEEGSVGASINLNAVAEWPQVVVGENRAVGVVTGINVDPGDEVKQGSTLYTVNLRPVVVAEGKVPAFRSIGSGTEGADVAQLQRMLAARAGYAGPIDGYASWSTVEAIMRWQETMGVARSGVVELGDVVFVPQLPTRVALDDAIVYRGATLSGGEKAIQGLPAAPTFSVPVTDAQARMIPAGTRVELTSPSGAEWVAFAGGQSTDPETATVTVALEAEGDGAICGDHCAEVPVVGDALLGARIVTVETVEGLVLPSAALVTDATGDIAVIAADGERIPVEVIASARGMSVIEGLDAGTRVRVPGEESPDASG